MQIRDTKILQSKKFDKAEKLVVVLHGYGACGGDFLDAAEFFMPSDLENAVFLFPNAPFPCEAGIGYQWFRLDDMSYEGLRAGLEIARPIVCEYIQAAAEEYSCDDINLIGFSQGAITCFEVLYCLNVAKIVAYSGLFAVPKNKAIVSKDASVLIVHSEDDSVVPYRNAELAKKSLDIIGLKSKIMTCRGIGHSISEPGWKAGFDFINSYT